MLLLLLACTDNALNRPNAVALSEDGRIHVSDFHNQRIVTFDEDGRFESTSGQRGLSGDGLWEVWGLLSDGSDLHVLNLRPTSRKDSTPMLEIKTFRDGDVVSVVPLKMADGSPTGWSNGFVKTDQGWLIASPDDDALLSFAPDGQFVTERTTPTGGLPLHAPSAAHGEAGDTWIIEQFDNRIRHLDASGRELLVFGKEGGEPGALRFPTALDVCDQGAWLVVTDLGNYRVQRFSPDGVFIDGFEPPNDSHDSPLQLMDIELSSDCERMVLVDSKGDRVLLARPDGTIYGELSTW